MSTDLRTQFLNYMTLQRFSQYTKKNYVTAVRDWQNSTINLQTR